MRIVTTAAAATPPQSTGSSSTPTRTRSPQTDSSLIPARGGSVQATADWNGGTPMQHQHHARSAALLLVRHACTPALWLPVVPGCSWTTLRTFIHPSFPPLCPMGACAVIPPSRHTLKQPDPSATSPTTHYSTIASSRFGDSLVLFSYTANFVRAAHKSLGAWRLVDLSMGPELDVSTEIRPAYRPSDPEEKRRAENGECRIADTL